MKVICREENPVGTRLPMSQARCVSSKNESIYKPGEIYGIFMLEGNYHIQSETSKMNTSFVLSGMILSKAIEIAGFEILN